MLLSVSFWVSLAIGCFCGELIWRLFLRDLVARLRRPRLIAVFEFRDGANPPIPPLTPKGATGCDSPWTAVGPIGPFRFAVLYDDRPSWLQRFVAAIRSRFR